MIKGLYEAHLPVTDLARSINFYSKLGLQLAFQDEKTAFFWIVPQKSWVGLWKSECGTEREPASSPENGRHLSFEVDYADITYTINWLKQRGIEVRQIKHMEPAEPICRPHQQNASVYFWDPDGNSLEFICNLPPGPTEPDKVIRLSEWESSRQTKEMVPSQQVRGIDKPPVGYMMGLRRLIGSSPVFLVGACVLVFNDEGHLLLQKRTDSYDWGTIGGSLELGETFEQAAARELYEEAGVRAKELNFITLLSGQDLYYTYPNGDEVYNVLAVYSVTQIQGVPIVNDDEGLELRYFNLLEPIPDLNPLTQIVLNKSGYVKD